MSDVAQTSRQLRVDAMIAHWRVLYTTHAILQAKPEIDALMAK